MLFKAIFFALTAATGIGIYLMPRLMPSCACTCGNRLDGKTVLITGGSDGIGRETAADLAGRGARVIIAARNLTKLNEAAEYIRAASRSDNIVVKELDLASFASIRAVVADVKASEKALHILINNAGVMGAPQSKTRDGFEMQFGVNHLGHFLLTTLLLDLLKASEPSRVVVVSSTAHRIFSLDYDDLEGERSPSPWIAYCRSKLANVLFVKELAKRLAGTGISVYSVHPGTVATGLFQHMPFFIEIFFRNFLSAFLKTPVEGAQTTIHCAVCPGLEAQTGAYFSECMPTPPSSDALDEEGAARLWAESERLVALV